MRLVLDGETRVAAACGLAFTALMALSVALVPAAPEYDAGGTAIRAYLTGHADALGISTALTGAASLALMAFLGFVHGRLRGAERDGGPVSANVHGGGRGRRLNDARRPLRCGNPWW
jgi:hypothetical protein